MEISRKQRWICAGAVTAVLIAQAKWPNIKLVVNCLLIAFFTAILLVFYVANRKKRRRSISVDSSDTE
jgi:hypothetical protein